MLERGEKLDNLVERSNALSAQSKMFYKTAKKVSCFVSLRGRVADGIAKLLLCHHVGWAGDSSQYLSDGWTVVQVYICSGRVNMLHAVGIHTTQA